jgi:hypothetical protein
MTEDFKKLYLEREMSDTKNSRIVSYLFIISGFFGIYILLKNFSILTLILTIVLVVYGVFRLLQCNKKIKELKEELA